MAYIAKSALVIMLMSNLYSFSNVGALAARHLPVLATTSPSPGAFLLQNSYGFS